MVRNLWPCQPLEKKISNQWIRQQTSCTYILKKNGLVVRKNRQILKFVCALIFGMNMHVVVLLGRGYEILMLFNKLNIIQSN